jgi:hypothetical protein
MQACSYAVVRTLRRGSSVGTTLAEDASARAISGDWRAGMLPCRRASTAADKHSRRWRRDGSEGTHPRRQLARKHADLALGPAQMPLPFPVRQPWWLGFSRPRGLRRQSRTGCRTAAQSPPQDSCQAALATSEAPAVVPVFRANAPLFRSNLPPWPARCRRYA